MLGQVKLRKPPTGLVTHRGVISAYKKLLITITARELGILLIFILSKLYVLYL